jgi:hypothetical protein
MVYVKEVGGYKPYLVLTNKYNGNTLLLREYLLPEIHIFNPLSPIRPNKNNYENSAIDEFLNSEYKKTLDEAIQSMIVPSTVIITKTDKYGKNIRETIEIVRDIFLLSVTEIGRNRYTSSVIEGTTLKYFEIVENRMALDETGMFDSWWLRTPSLSTLDTAFFYTYDNQMGGGAVYYLSGVRPAFCVSGDEPITTRDDIIPGEEVYVFG